MESPRRKYTFPGKQVNNFHSHGLYKLAPIDTCYSLLDRGKDLIRLEMCLFVGKSVFLGLNFLSLSPHARWKWRDVLVLFPNLCGNNHFDHVHVLFLQKEVMGIVCLLARVNKLKVNSLSHRQQAHRPPTVSPQAHSTHESKCLLKFKFWLTGLCAGSD